MLHFDDFRLHFPYIPTQDQQRSMELIANFLNTPDSRSAFMLKGYAGTGKTSLIAALVETLQGAGIGSVLLAPTGRAAKVLSTYAKKRAFTIHKKIYRSKHNPDGSAVFSLAKNTYKNVLFIVDEASMIGLNAHEEGLFQHRKLLDDLISYIQSGEHCKLLLAGDIAQLPPVGCSESPALNPDFLRASYNLVFHYFELSEVVRQALDSSILRNASNLRWRLAKQQFKTPLFRISKQKKDFVALPPEQVADTLQEAYSACDLSDVVILCRSNKRANMYNRQIRYQALFRENEIEAGDLIMSVKNNYFWLDESSESGFIANGDILKIQSIRNIHEKYGFRFAEMTVLMVDYPEQAPVDIMVILDTLYTEAPSLNEKQHAALFHKVMEDYADLPSAKQRLDAVKHDPHFQAVQIKFAYALTGHKSQGGQWKIVFIDQGFFQEDMLDEEYIRWLYTAVTRAQEKVFLMGFPENFFLKETTENTE